jgi:arsenate reductase-like glutaredoxin family protein
VNGDKRLVLENTTFLMHNMMTTGISKTTLRKWISEKIGKINSLTPENKAKLQILQELYEDFNMDESEEFSEMNLPQEVIES